MKQSGFSMIEVLIAMTIGSFMMLANANLQITNIKNSAITESMSRATLIASSSLAITQGTFNNLEESAVTDEIISGNIVYTVTSTNTLVSNRLMGIETVVRWKRYEKPYRIAMSTIAPKAYIHSNFKPFAPKPIEFSCIDADKGHGNDFWGVDLDNPGKAVRVPTVGEEVVCGGTSSPGRK